MAKNSIGPRGRLHPAHGKIEGQLRLMNLWPQFSTERFKGIVLKEFIQMRRDRLTFAMMLGIPLMQLILFGYAINVNPRHLPVDILLGDNGPQGRTLLYAFKNTDYFDFVRLLKSDDDG